MRFKKIILLITLLIPHSIYPVSNAVISNQEYRKSLEILRELNIIISNFGTDTEKENLKKIRDNFQIAAQRHYGRHFINISSLTYKKEKSSEKETSIDLFYDLKLQLIDLYSELSQFYIFRTQEILDSIAKETVDIIVEYGRGGGRSKYFFSRPIDPLKDNKPYDADKFHYFRIRATIEEYLDCGYRNLEDAQKVFDDVDYIYIMSKDKKTNKELSFILQKHRDAIKLARQGKECGIAIYQTLYTHKMSEILYKYDVSSHKVTQFPIYDDRIPEPYKVDATDNRKLLFSVEKQRIGNYDELNPKSAELTNPNNQKRPDSPDKKDTADKDEEVITD